MIYSRIAGTGSYLPEKILTNDDLVAMGVDTSDQWIRERTGIEQRHVAAEGELTSDLAEKAARKAIEAAGIDAAEIDFVILGTTSSDVVFPSTACKVQARLGCPGGPAMDVNAACTSFMYALSIADQYIRSGASRCALVMGAETLTRMLDWNDRSTCVLFGDGAGAVILKPSEEPGILSTHMHADGNYTDLLHTSVGVSSGFRIHEPRAGVKVAMKGNEVFKMAVKTLGQTVVETLEANRMSQSDIDWLVPHQANYRIIAATAKKLKMDMDQVIVTVNRHGNTSAASVPLALDYGVRSGRIQRGQTMLLEAFGGGFTWASAMIRY